MIVNRKNRVVQFNGRELDDDARLRACGIKNNSVVTYAVRAAQKKKVKVNMTFVNMADGSRDKKVMTDPTQEDVYEHVQKLVGAKRFYVLVTQDGKRFGKATAMDQEKLNMIILPVGM